LAVAGYQLGLLPDYVATITLERPLPISLPGMIKIHRGSMWMLILMR
jgi:hypothetical protein